MVRILKAVASLVIFAASLNSTAPLYGVKSRLGVVTTDILGTYG